MSDQTISVFIGEAKKALAGMAEGAMQFPKADPFEHGVQCGRHQGVQFALDILDNILRDKFEKESNS